MSDYFARSSKSEEVTGIIKQRAYPLTDKGSLDPLFKRIGDARIVMLGEASHGTHDYYNWRSYISRRLIEEKGFNFIAVEGDWPDCYRLNRYIKNYADEGKGAFKVLHSFNRWPTWMWANWEVVALADWLQQYNLALPLNKKAGFYGLDVYSLWESMESIMQYLGKKDPQTLKIAEEVFKCFEPYRYQEGRSYARATQFVPESCENEVVRLLKEIRAKLPSYNTDHENVFNAEQNALVMVDAERYYRAMIHGGAHAWNIRDDHMAQTLDRLLKFHGEKAKAIIWAHNTHVGDARATSMSWEGMFNIGELARLKYGDDKVVLVGFGSYKGAVIAGSSWGASMRKIEVPPAFGGSWEHLLHTANSDNKLLIMSEFNQDVFLENHFGHRAIGVVYHPQYEQYGNYVPTILPLRYDAFIYLDETSALHPLHIQPDGHQMPETFPFGV
ncbi:erythromycin esterase family protein [Chitinophaga oryzae]|uniref:Erythromycin esterase family protein n=1 Tax=Chitinophaga oryzae TaxID=2725414 RepID=A0AAE6ZE18_9BACT|nr:erythromycin esterase family protein [Chitinophaga oryzae]QJB30157.1 erythromycin esterase family protein [Chitinophaga oryzae]